MERLEDKAVSDIMRHWPATIRVFLDAGMHCVGCPIGPFHSLEDAAIAHGDDLARLTAAVEAAIAAESKADPDVHRRR